MNRNTQICQWGLSGTHIQKFVCVHIATLSPIQNNIVLFCENLFEGQVVVKKIKG
jgi:hypothetical protein